MFSVQNIASSNLNRFYGPEQVFRRTTASRALPQGHAPGKSLVVAGATRSMRSESTSQWVSRKTGFQRNKCYDSMSSIWASSGIFRRGPGTRSLQIKKHSWKAVRRVTVKAVKEEEVESNKLSENVREGVLKAIEDLGGVVTVGEVAGAAGLKVAEAEAGLLAVAQDTQAQMRVSDTGDLLFQFPLDPRQQILAKSTQLRIIQPTLKKLKTGFDYIVRVSFGTTLIVSLVIVYVAITAILTSSKSDNNNDSRRSSSGFNGDMGFRMFPSDIFWYWDPLYYTRQVQPEKMGFLESVFSFVFGDGDPNKELDQVRWETIGNLIQKNGGVVTAEQLAPFLDLPEGYNKDTDSLVVDESYTLPVLQRFQGSPVVNAEGQLLYEFPSLQTSASSSQTYRFSRDKSGEYLEESMWTLSEAPKGKLIAAVILGVANFVGVGVLTRLLGDPAVIQQIMMSVDGGRGIISLAATLLPFLQVYAATFFAIPAVRFLLQSRRNAKIQQRNEAREASALQLTQPGPGLRKKLQQAKNMFNRRVIRDDDIAYDTNKDVIEQDLEKSDFDDFDRKLAESSRKNPKKSNEGKSSMWN